MRRLLIVCAVAVLAASVFSVFAVAQKGSSSAAAGQANPGPKALVLASGIAIRTVALDAHANLFVTNASAPDRIFTLTGVSNLLPASDLNALASARLALVAGNGTTGSLGDGGAALASQFDMELDSLLLRSGIVIAPDGTILIADTLNSTIRRVAGSDSSEPGVIRSVAGRWGPRQEITLAEPLGLALDHAANLYIADRAAGAVDVLPFASDASSTPKLAILAHVASPASIALTSDGTKAFVASADTGAIFEINTQSHAISAIPGFTAQTSETESASRCRQQSSAASESSVPCPAGLAVDGGGNLFVADAASGRILRVDSKSQQVTAAASGLKSPGDITFDASGNLYVADQGANQLLRFAAMGDPTGNLTITSPAALPPPPAPRSCPATAPFNFCDQPTGGATATQAFTLTNTTAAALTGITISFTGADPGDFQAASNTCGSSLGAGASCSINVDFAPAVAGPRAATLSVTDSVDDSATANVSGTGDDYQVTLNGTNQEQSVFQGGTVTFKFNITPDAVFGGVVTIVCPESSQMPNLTSCTPNPTMVTVTPGTPAPFVVTFATTYNGIMGTIPTSSLLPASFPRDGGASSAPASLRPSLLAAVLLLVALSLCWWRFSPVRWPRKSKLAWASFALVIACTATFLTACHHSAIQPGLNTPLGETNVTIRGTAQNAGRGNTIILDVVAH